MVQRRLTDFEARYNDTARSFQWKFTTHDITDVLERLERRAQAGPISTEQPDPVRTYAADH
jgi:hypothetical protein